MVNLQVSSNVKTKSGNLPETAKIFMLNTARMFKKQFMNIRKNVNRSKYKNVRISPKLKRPTSESQFKLKEKLPTESALDKKTMNTHRQKSGLLISQAMNNFNQAKLETTYLFQYLNTYF